MNGADQLLIRWLQMEIRTGKRVIIISAQLLEQASADGLDEARRLAKISGCEVVFEQ